MISWVKALFREKLPRFAVRHPWIVIISFVLVVVFFGYQLSNIYIDTDVTNLTTGGEEETRAIETAARDFTVGDPLYLVLLGDMNDPQVLQKASDLVRQLRTVPNVYQMISPFDTSYFNLSGFLVQSIPVATKVPTTQEEVDLFRSRLAQSPNGKRLISENGQAMLIETYIFGSYSSRGEQAVQELEEILKAEWGSGNYNMTGTSYLTHAMDQSIRRDVMLLFPLAVLVVIFVLALSFRNTLGFIVPGATVLVAIFVSIGLMALLNYPLTLVSMILPVILIVVGSANGIHVLHKYKEELYKGVHPDKEDAILATMEKMVPPCTMTSLTTAVGLFSLQTSSVIPVKDFGLFSGIGVMVAYFFAVVGIPAILTLMPQTKPEALNISARSTILLDKIGKFVLANSRLVILVGVALFILISFGMTKVTVEANIARYFRSNSSVAEGIRVYEEHFGGSQQILVVVDSQKPQGTFAPTFLPLVDELEQFVGTFDLVSHTSSMASISREFSPDGELHSNLVPIAFQQLPRDLTSFYLSRDQQQKAGIHAWIRSSDTNQLANTLMAMENGLDQLTPDDVTVTVAGLPKIIQHHMHRFSQSQIASIFGSIFAVFALLVIFNKSFAEGFVAMIPLIFTIGINFGVMGWFGIPLDAATVLIGSIAIGMGIDYSIHFITRVNNEIEAGSNYQEACQISISTAGNAIMINAVTLIAGFLVLCFSLFSTLAIFGILMALAMGISAIATITILPVLLQRFRNKSSRRALDA